MDEPLLRAARQAASQAYVPYSKYPVGVALEAADGRVFTGCNVENASYGLTICAERSALASAVVAGVRRFRRLVLVTSSDPAAAPCGACRQVLAEFGTELIVESVGPKSRRRWTLGELLPDGFGPGDLPDPSTQTGLP